MSYARPPGAARAIRMVAGLALRRQLNRWRSFGFGGKAPAARSGTPTKSGRQSSFGAVLFVLMVLSGFAISAGGIVRISAMAQNVRQPRDKIVVNPYTYASLEQIDKALQQLKELNDPAVRARFGAMWDRHLDRLLISEIRWGAYTDAEENARLRQMRDLFRRAGASGFAPSQAGFFNISAATLPHAPRAKAAFLNSLNLLFALWIPISVMLALGFNNKDLSQVEWSFEWLYTFPVSARALFVSRLVVYSIFDQMVWWLLLPFSMLAFVAAGWGWTAVALGLGTTLYLAVVSGSISTVAEVALRKFLSLDRLKNTQALFTVVGTGCLLIFYAAMFSSPVAMVLSHLGGSSSGVLSWNPVALPLTLATASLSGWQRTAGVIAMAIAMSAAMLLAAGASEWLTRDGLVKAQGPYQAGRRQFADRIGRGWLRGIAAQELLLLRRDRNLLVQVLLVPLLIPAYYLFIDPHLRSVLVGNFRRAAVVSFLVGAYAFVSSAIPLLNRENKTLWFLVALPRSLVSILIEKTLFWAVFGLLYGALVLAALVHFSPHLQVTSWSYVVLVLYGIGLYAFIAAGIGILAADVFETEPRAQLKVSLLYLYFALAGMYTYVFYADSVWTGLALLILSTLLAFALWQKVRDMAPFLLDPTQWPPRALSLADGMIAALAFFVAQPLLQMLLQTTSPLSLSAQITVSYLLAGLLVGAAVLLIFWMQHVPRLWQQIGLGGFDRATTARAVAIGVLAGGVAAAGAFAYLHVLDLLPQWHIWKQDAELSSFLFPSTQPFWIWLLLVLAAPLVEEFLFRGLIFQGIRRTAGPLLAVVGSAALFALVHPPIAVIPVFGLGIAAALSLNESGLLLAPILAHAVYNGCVLLLNRM
jgi:ABC-2 type transport system permease protein